LADLGAKHALLLAGVGWGNMPEHMIRDDVKAGRLKILDLPDWRGGHYAFRAIHRTDSPPGPAGAWLVERFWEQPDAGFEPMTKRPIEIAVAKKKVKPRKR
jgi:DNA-binding transcriptional LysR family regulator